MTQVWQPRPWQHQMLDHLLNHPRCALWADLGMGKTSTTLMALAGRKAAGIGGKALVLAPLRVARDVWPDEQRRWAQLEDFTVQPIIGDASERTAALKNDKADVYTCNYENLPWLVDKVGVDNWPWRTVIPDEARRLHAFRTQQGGKQTAALAKIAWNKVDYLHELTGRPAPNGIGGLWGQLWYIDRGLRLGRSFSAFENRWFGYTRAAQAVSAGKGGFVQRVVFPHSQDEIQALIKDLCLTVDPKDWFDVKEPITRRIEVTLPKAARKAYREMEREYFTKIENHEIEAFAAAGKSMKCIALASGSVYVDGDTTDWVVTHDEKIQALRSIVEEASTSVLVSYFFVSNLKRLLKAFPEGVDLSTRAGMAAFKAGDAPIGFGHPQSIGEGTNDLEKVSNTVAFFDQWWDMDKRDQFIGRIGPTRQVQAGFDRPVFVYDIVARGTIDEDVLERHASKRSVQDILLEAMKRRRE
jgi:SNF2 family DNA or RNA helicase